MLTDRAYHDTYYVVGHAQYAFGLFAILAGVLALWSLIHRWRGPSARKARNLTLATIAVGLTPQAAPMAFLALSGAQIVLENLWLFGWINVIALIGGLLVAAAVLASLLYFAIAGLARFGR